jgi:hypothetical protein
VNGGLNESEKSGAVTLTKTDVNLVRLPRVPWMVTKKDCDGADRLAVTVRVTEADAPLVSVTLDLLRVELTPDRPNWNVERVTVPLNPLRLVIVIVDCADDPGLTCSENGFG